MTEVSCLEKVRKILIRGVNGGSWAIETLMEALAAASRGGVRADDRARGAVPRVSGHRGLWLDRLRQHGGRGMAHRWSCRIEALSLISPRIWAEVNSPFNPNLTTNRGQMNCRYYFTGH